MSASGFTHPEPLPPEGLWAAWNFEPLLLIPLVLTALVYGWGVRNAWRRAGLGRGVSFRSSLSFAGALLALVVALISPLEAMSGVLFSAHMAQHLILVLVAAPLLLLSDFPLAVLWALPRPWGQIMGRQWKSSPISSIRQVATSAISAWFLFTLVLWAWHAPKLYEAALGHEAIHALEHLGLIGTAVLFWGVLVNRRMPDYLHLGKMVPYLFLTVLQSGILGAIMTFSAEPWYATYTAFAPTWGLTPLQDQQLAGLIMWLPGGAVYTLLTIGYFSAWLRALERQSERLLQRDSFRPSQELE